MSKVTLIITSYNERNYIEKAYKSCKDQTYGDIEILFADDGSDDGTQEIIRSIANEDETVRFFVMDRDVSDANDIIASVRVTNLIKRAICDATGEYIAVLAGDDWFCDERKIEDAVKFLDSEKTYFSYASGYKKVSGDKEEIFLPSIASNNAFVGSGYLHASCFVFRKPTREQMLDRFMDDVGLVYILCLSGRIKCSNAITFAYNQRDDSIMHSIDIIEHDLLELMLYQDILNYRDRTGDFLPGIEARMLFPIIRIRQNRHYCSSAKYEKYLKMCESYHNDIVGILVNDTNKSFLFKVRIFGWIIRLFYMRMLYKVISMMYKYRNHK